MLSTISGNLADADRVVNDLNTKLNSGIGNRKIFYRDSIGRFDELAVKNGSFDGFRPCSKHQQEFLAELVN